MKAVSLEEVLSKRSRLTLGLMSGTSADGLDIAYCEVNVSNHSLKNLASETILYPSHLREKILTIARARHVDLAELLALSSYLGHFYADAIELFCRQHEVTKRGVDLVGSHGQTIAHLSRPLQYLDRSVTGTLQIGEAEVIAKRLGAITVSDFRNGDIALGGSGAPLTPIYHRAVFSQEGKINAVVNIGGIANITLLKSDGECVATDTGPGNCLLDTVVKNRTAQRFDDSGKLASSGTIDEVLLSMFLQTEVLQRKLPVSHDRGEILRMLDDEDIAKSIDKINTEILLATLGELTSITIKRATDQLLESAAPNSVIVCGGGAHNSYLMRRLQHHFSRSKVLTAAEFGADVDFVEAEAFAYLANLTLNSLSGNLPQVTGASRAAILGKISQP